MPSRSLNVEECPTKETKVDARSPEGIVFGRGLVWRDMRRRLASGCGGWAWLMAFHSRSETQPVGSRYKSKLTAHSEHSQKNSVLSDRRSSAYRSPPLRSLNSSRQAGLTHLLSIRVNLGTIYIRTTEVKAVIEITSVWGFFNRSLRPVTYENAITPKHRFQMRSHRLPGVAWPCANYLSANRSTLCCWPAAHSQQTVKRPKQR